MNTTTLLVEIVVVGLMGFSWVILAFVAGGGQSAIAALRTFVGADPFDKSAVLAFLFAFSYAVGIIVNRMADTFLALLDSDLRRNFFQGSGPESLIRWRQAFVAVTADNERITTRLDHGRTLLRVARSSVVSFALIALLLPVATWRVGYLAGHWPLVLTISCLAVIFAACSFFAWKRLAIADYDILRTAQQRLRLASVPASVRARLDQTGATEFDFSVQAVVFRVKDGEPEFLLLKRTKDRGDFWQSVTGRIEEGESPRVAAVRETEEETGCRAMSIWPLAFTHEFVKTRKLPTGAMVSIWNLEASVGIQLSFDAAIRLDAHEHTEYRWLPHREACGLVKHDTNRQAIRELAETYARSMRRQTAHAACEENCSSDGSISDDAA